MRNCESTGQLSDQYRGSCALPCSVFSIYDFECSYRVTASQEKWKCPRHHRCLVLSLHVFSPIQDSTWLLHTPSSPTCLPCSLDWPGVDHLGPVLTLIWATWLLQPLLLFRSAPRYTNTLACSSRWAVIRCHCTHHLWPRWAHTQTNKFDPNYGFYTNSPLSHSKPHSGHI